MEISLVESEGDRPVSKSEQALLYRGIKASVPFLAKSSLTKPKVAYYCAMAALASAFGKSAQEWKNHLICEVLGSKSPTIRISLGGISMLFGEDDIQVENVIIANQYDADRSVIFGKVVIDAGANTGVFSILAAKLGAAKVYAFEPIAENVALIRRNAERNGVCGVIEPVQMALGKEEGECEIEYEGEGDPSASLAFDHPRHGIGLKKQRVKITTIDSFCRSNRVGPVGFIKMDIEGFEEEALLGGKETIASFKPTLSFSAYHKSTDKEVLPRTVKRIRQDYEGKLLARAEDVFVFR